ncbi:MAG: enoyl-CoA hydratase [Gammaproteobacteria bacterium]|nr:MAG: enoyl-CoA hydratase [Gammaproteobacteria bacterium]
MTENQEVLITIEQGIMSITLNRPEKKNALTNEMYQSIVTALKHGASDDQVRVVLFSGKGDSFTAGNDIADFLKAGGTKIHDLAVGKLILTMESYKKPIVAAVQGNAIGIGTTLLLHCDLVVAAKESRFALPFVKLGLCPEAGSSMLLPKLVGYQQAAELLFLGEPFDAEKAEKMGLINRLVDTKEVKLQALALCQKLTALPEDALLATKALLKAPEENLRDRIFKEFKDFDRLLKSKDAKRIFQAFLAK